jgi:hypothetical protein
LTQLDEGIKYKTWKYKSKINLYKLNRFQIS